MHFFPYIGVTGVKNKEESRRILELWKGLKHDRALMMGIPVSHKTIAGVQDKGVAAIEELTKMIKTGGSEDHFFAVHYYTKPPGQVRGDAARVARHVVEMPLPEQVATLYEGLHPHRPVLQLNVFPEAEELKKIKRMVRGVIQQFNPDRYSLDQLEQLLPYVDCVLIDSSLGTGKPLDTRKSTGLYQAIMETGYGGEISFAGGLSPENVYQTVLEFRRRLGHKGFSIDAEGRLKTNGELDIQKVGEYLKGAVMGFQGK